MFSIEIKRSIPFFLCVNQTLAIVKSTDNGITINLA